MTKKQFKKAAAVIKKDASLQWSYLTRKGDSCVIGGLLLAVRFPKRIINDMEGAAIGAICREPNDEVGPTLARAFGLTAEQLQVLQTINDRFKTVAVRRKKLIAKLKTFVD